MSFIGEVIARLNVRRTDVFTVESAELSPQKEVQPGQLFQGKTWSEVKDLIPILFGLCPYAQSAAGFIASEFARGNIISDSDKADLARSVLCENVTEFSKFLFLTCGKYWMDDESLEDAQKIFRALNKLRATEKIDADDFQSTFLEIIPLFRKTLDQGMDDFPFLSPEKQQISDTAKITRLFTKLSKDPKLGLKNTGLPDTDNPQEGSEESTDLLFQCGPHMLTTPAQENSIYQRLLEEYGDTNYTRFVAIYLNALDTLERIAEEKVGLRGTSLFDQSGISFVEISRGILSHKIWIDETLTEDITEEAVIKDYQIVTPTDWLIKSGMGASAFISLSAKSEQALLEQAELTGLSLNLCLPIKYELHYA